MESKTVAEALLSSGFTEVLPGTTGPTGVQNRTGLMSRIFINNSHDRVARIASDGAYAVFVDWARRNPSVTVPKFYCHRERGARDAYGYWTYTRMERLFELTTSEASEVESWFKEFVDSRGQTAHDPFRLLSTLKSLWQLAIASSYGVEVTKSSNVMVRVRGNARQFVFADMLN